MVPNSWFNSELTWTFVSGFRYKLYKPSQVPVFWSSRDEVGRGLSWFRSLEKNSIWDYLIWQKITRVIQTNLYKFVTAMGHQARDYSFEKSWVGVLFYTLMINVNPRRNLNWRIRWFLARAVVGCSDPKGSSRLFRLSMESRINSGVGPRTWCSEQGRNPSPTKQDWNLICVE